MKKIFEFGNWYIERWNTRSKNYKVFRAGRSGVYYSSNTLDGAMWAVGAWVTGEMGYSFRNFDEWANNSTH